MPHIDPGEFDAAALRRRMNRAAGGHADFVHRHSFAGLMAASLPETWSRTLYGDHPANITSGVTAPIVPVLHERILDICAAPFDRGPYLRQVCNHLRREGRLESGHGRAQPLKGRLDGDRYGVWETRRLKL